MLEILFMNHNRLKMQGDKIQDWSLLILLLWEIFKRNFNLLHAQCFHYHALVLSSLIRFVNNFLRLLNSPLSISFELLQFQRGNQNISSELKYSHLLGKEDFHLKDFRTISWQLYDMRFIVETTMSEEWAEHIAAQHGKEQ